VKKENAVTEWSDFTNKVLGILGKFVLLPLVVIGGLISLLGNGLIGMLMMFGACFLFLIVALILIAFKPLIVKKYPEPKRTLRPVSFLVELPNGEQKEETIMTTGKYKVSSSTSRSSLTRIQKLAVDKCSGDIEAAMYYLVTYMSAENQVAYTNNLLPQETAAYMSLLNTQAEQKYTKKELQQVVNQSVRLAHLDMSAEQVLAAEKNPFSKKMWLSIAALLGCSIAFGVLIGLSSKNEFLGYILPGCLGVAMTFFVYRVVANILNFFRFRKAQRFEQAENAKQDSAPTTK